MSVLEKLLAVQTELKAPKNQFNKFGGYAYRSCEDILEAVKPILAKHKCTLVLDDAIRNIGDRYYIQATATFVDIETAETIRASAIAREDESKKGMDLSQLSGATSSYARKYALNALFLIDDNKDSDVTADGSGSKSEAKKAAPKTEAKPKFEAAPKPVSVSAADDIDSLF